VTDGVTTASDSITSGSHVVRTRFPSVVTAMLTCSGSPFRFLDHRTTTQPLEAHDLDLDPSSRLDMTKKQSRSRHHVSHLGIPSPSLLCIGWIRVSSWANFAPSGHKPAGQRRKQSKYLSFMFAASAGGHAVLLSWLNLARQDIRGQALAT
jgi:hypothetical protein